jgi:hypothetical protein
MSPVEETSKEEKKEEEHEVPQEASENDDHHLGLRCPSCRRVFTLRINFGKINTVEGTRMLHCPLCKEHPALNILVPWEISQIVRERMYPPAGFYGEKDEIKAEPEEKIGETEENSEKN